MEPFVGQIQAFGFNFAPIGWAKCEGQLMSIASNNALFSLLGTYYGGDGRTTFGLPDFRGRTIVHQGVGPGLHPAKIGARGGNPYVTLTQLNLPNHKHAISGSLSVGVSEEDANQSEGNGKYLAGATIYNSQTSGGQLGGLQNNFDIVNSGNSQQTYVQNPFLTVNICIALVGVYPSRN